MKNGRYRHSAAWVHDRYCRISCQIKVFKPKAFTLRCDAEYENLRVAVCELRFMVAFVSKSFFFVKLGVEEKSKRMSEL